MDEQNEQPETGANNEGLTQRGLLYQTLRALDDVRAKTGNEIILSPTGGNKYYLSFKTTEKVHVVSTEAVEYQNENLTAFYQARYDAGDLSFLVSGQDDSLTNEPADLLPFIKKEMAIYKDSRGLDVLPLARLLFDTDKETGRVILDLIIERANDRRRINAPSITGSSYALLNDKTISEMIRGTMGTVQAPDIEGQMRFIFALDQAGQGGAGAPILISGYKDGKPVKTSKLLSVNQAAAFDALCTCIFNLKKNGYTAPYYISPEEIWRKRKNIFGNKRTPTAKQRQRTIDCILEMASTQTYIDLRKEIENRDLIINDERVVKGVAITYLINAEFGDFETERGRKVGKFKINNDPFLWVYSEAKGATLYLDYGLLDVSDTVQDNERVEGFTRYLAQQIQLMYMGRRNNSRILYETIYRDTDTMPPAERIDQAKYKTDAAWSTDVRGATRDDRNTIDKILLSWINRGWILDANKFKKGRSYSGVEIKLDPEKIQKRTRKRR